MPENPSTPQDETPKLLVYKTDKDGNEILRVEKFVAGLLLILFTLASAFGIVALWPDRLVDAKEDIKPLYKFELFHVRLACVADSICCEDCIGVVSLVDSLKQKPIDTPIVVNQDFAKNADSIKAANDENITKIKPARHTIDVRRLIHINTLILILVALGGFLGNMIHVATSFTTYIGSGKFRRSWLLWYCIKPFTAAALAVGLYFVFRGGFLNMSDGASGINLYGLMTISLMTGLFTDRATEKLKEIFEVIFKAKEERPDPLIAKLKIAGITPSTIEAGKENILVIGGEKLNSEKLFVTINGETISNNNVSDSSITLKYTIPETQQGKSEFILKVNNEKGDSYYSVTLTLKKEETDSAPSPDTEGDNENTENTPDPGLG